MTRRTHTLGMQAARAGAVLLALSTLGYLVFLSHSRAQSDSSSPQEVPAPAPNNSEVPAQPVIPEDPKALTTSGPIYLPSSKFLRIEQPPIKTDENLLEALGVSGTGHSSTAAPSPAPTPLPSLDPFLRSSKSGAVPRGVLPLLPLAPLTPTQIETGTPRQTQAPSQSLERPKKPPLYLPSSKNDVIRQ